MTPLCDQHSLPSSPPPRPPPRPRPRARRLGGRLALAASRGAALAAGGAGAAEPPVDPLPVRAPADDDTPPPPAAITLAPGGLTMSLAQAEETALKNQPNLRQARANTDAAAGRVEQARSGYLPQVTATGTYERTTSNFTPRPGFQPTAGVTVPPATNATFNYFSFGLTGSQLIYDFGLTSDKWRSAAASHDAARLSEDTTITQLVATVRHDYFQARAQQDLVTVAEESVANQKRHVAQIEGLVKVGIRPEIDLASTLTDLANAQVQQINAVNAVRVAKAQLGQAMGITRDDYDLTDADLKAPPDEEEPLTGLVDKALRARPEVAVLEQQRRAQALTLASDRGAYGPSLGVIASATEAGLALDALVPNWFLGLNLNWALLQGGLTTGQVHEAAATLRGFDAQMDALRLQVRVDVEQAQLNLYAAKATSTASEKALTNAREQLRLAEARYTQGLGSVIELNDAQVAFTTAEAQLVQARYGILIARAQLLGALGRR
jgi:outer membrane protein